MKPIFIPICALALICMVALNTNAKKITTRLKAPIETESVFANRCKTYPHHASEFEKVSDHLAFMAYDKKASASKETFFVDNGSDFDLKSLDLEISYYNESGKLIHKRTVEIEEEFPHKETRKVDISSWDTQKSYHYINSVPSTKGSTPYTVKFRVLSFTKN